MPPAVPEFPRRSRVLLVAGAIALGLLTSDACAKKEVVAQAPPPPLEVPVVPPRLVGPVVVEEPPMPTTEVPEPAPVRQRPPRNAGRGNGSGASAGTEPVVRVEPPQESPKTPETPNGQPSASGASAEAAPPPLLRTQDTADDASVAKSVQETLQRAQQNLDKVNYQPLNSGAKGQYDTARRFIAQALDALKSRRIDFARYLADKADRLSASLLNR
jgi:hypothetical protein